MLFKARVLLLSLVALLLMGSITSGMAYAEAGPFLNGRVVGEKGEGEDINEYNPVEVQGGGGEQKLKGKIVGMATEIAFKEVQVKGVIYDNKLQGQADLKV